MGQRYPFTNEISAFPSPPLPRKCSYFIFKRGGTLSFSLFSPCFSEVVTEIYQSFIWNSFSIFAARISNNHAFPHQIERSKLEITTRDATV